MTIPVATHTHSVQGVGAGPAEMRRDNAVLVGDMEMSHTRTAIKVLVLVDERGLMKYVFDGESFGICLTNKANS